MRGCTASKFTVGGGEIGVVAKIATSCLDVVLFCLAATDFWLVHRNFVVVALRCLNWLILAEFNRCCKGYSLQV